MKNFLVYILWYQTMIISLSKFGKNIYDNELNIENVSWTVL